MAPVKTVAVAGGSGALGKHIVQALLDAKVFEVSVLARDDSKKFPPGVKAIQTDYSPSSLEVALKGQDVVVVAVGAEAMDVGSTIFDAALKAGVKRYFPSEWGSDPTRPEFKDISLFKVKEKQTAYVKEHASEPTTWTIVENGAFTDWGLQVGFFGTDLKSDKIEIWDSGTKKLSSTSLSTVGKAVAAILSSPEHYEATKNQTVRIEGLTFSSNELKAALEKVTGKTFEVKPTTTSEAISSAKQKVAQGDHWAEFDIFKAVLLGDRGAGFFADNPNIELWNKKLGLQAENLEEIIHDVIGQGV